MEKYTKIFKNIVFIILITALIFILVFHESIREIYLIPLNVLIVLGVLLYFVLIQLYTTSNKSLEDTENEFIKIVNHTFRTPLTSINWLLKELKEDLEKEEKNNLIQRAENSTKKLIDITDLFAGIKQLDNQSSYEFKATSLRDIVENILTKYREDIIVKKITFNIPTFAKIPLITLDLNKISFAIESIIENNIIYNKEGGEININTEFKKSYIKIDFHDTGIGFSKKEKNKIFERFYRTTKAISVNPNGMGLKLYLSSKIIKMHNGKIEINSGGPDQGSTTTIILPLNK